MPSYELMLMIRTMPKHELFGTVKRVAQSIFEKNGLIRSLENLGHRPIPYTTSAHGVPYREATYYLMKFDSDTRSVIEIDEQCKRDVDIVRRKFYRVNETVPEPCTIHDEMQPPVYRPEVQKLIDIGKKQPKRFTYIFKYNSGLDYYPFQK